LTADIPHSSRFLLFLCVGSFFLWLSILHQRLTGISFPFPSVPINPLVCGARTTQPNFFPFPHVLTHFSIGSLVLARLQEYTWRDRSVLFVSRNPPLVLLSSCTYGSVRRLALRGGAGDASARVDCTTCPGPRWRKTAGKGFNQKCAEWRCFFRPCCVCCVESSCDVEKKSNGH
jgi:hypothetical protein